MPRNGTGSYSLPAGNPVVTGTVISSTTHNNTMSDVATALTNSIANDGQTTPTADLPMGTYKHTGVGNATARTNYYTAAQAQDGSIIYVGTVGGTADVITLTPAPAITAYAAGQRFRFIASGANTTNVTVNVSGVGAVALTKNGSTALIAGDITSGALIDITHDGTRFQLNNVSSSGAGSVVTTTGTQTLTNKTLTAPVIGTISNTGTLTLPTSTDTLVGRATTDTLTNKTLTSPTISDGLILGSAATYTPTVTLSSAGTTPQYSTTTGRYFRLGPFVFVNVNLSGDGGNEGSGAAAAIRVSLPINSSSTTQARFGVIGQAVNGSTKYILTAQLSDSASFVELNYWSSVSATAILVADNQNSVTRFIQLNFMYVVD